MDCGFCGLSTCLPCEERRKQIEESMKIKPCCPDCHCLCVYEMPNTLIADADIFSESFKVACGDPIKRKLIERIRNMEKAMILERIQYKTEKDTLQRKLTTMGLTIDKIVKELTFKGFNVRT